MGKWEMVRLGDHIEQIRGVSYKLEDAIDNVASTHIPILRAHNIQEMGLNANNLIFVDKRRIKEHKYIQKGDIVVCASSGSKDLVGKAAQAEENMSASFGAFCKVVRPKKTIESPYLKHYFSSPFYRFTISEVSAGANINNLRNEHIDDLQIPLPPLPIQQKIADVLDRASALIEKRKVQIEKLDLLIKSRFIEMFGDVFCGSEKFKKFPIATIIDENIERVSRVYSSADTIKYIDISSIDNFRNKIVQYTDYTLDVAPSRAQQVVKRGDVLVSTVRPNLKNVAIIKDEYENFVASTGFCVLRPSQQTNAEYIFAIVGSNEFAEYLSRMAKGASYPAVNGSDIKKFLLPVPPIDFQNRFADFVRQVEKIKLEMQLELDKLELLYKSLMQKSFGGEMFNE